MLLGKQRSEALRHKDAVFDHTLNRKERTCLRLKRNRRNLTSNENSVNL
jgi:hypothetical protein